MLKIVIFSGVIVVFAVTVVVLGLAILEWWSRRYTGLTLRESVCDTLEYAWVLLFGR